MVKAILEQLTVAQIIRK